MKFKYGDLVVVSQPGFYCSTLGTVINYFNIFDKTEYCVDIGNSIQRNFDESELIPLPKDVEYERTENETKT
jgi:hypothetical protein